jgi:hypothetical protein
VWPIATSRQLTRAANVTGFIIPQHIVLYEVTDYSIFKHYTVITLAIPCTHSNCILKYTCPLQYSLHLQRFKSNQSHIIPAVQTSTHLGNLCFWVVVWCQLLTIHVLPHLQKARCLPHLEPHIYLNCLYHPVFLNPDDGTDITY